MNIHFNYNLNLIKKRLVDEFPALGKYLKYNHGLIEHEDEEEYKMGASDDKIPWKKIKDVENPTWEPEANKMIHEVQRSGIFETMNCTKFALNNCLELLHLGKWNEVVNYSDRFPGKLQGTTRNGNSLSRQLENIRTYGCVLEKDFPWDREKFNWDDYYSNPQNRIMDKGKQWLKKNIFGYDGVWATKETINEALKYSPLYCGLYAWYKKGMLYYSVNNPNHVSVIISRNSFITYDSYSPHIKHLAEDFKIFYVKRIYLEKKELVFETDKIKKLENDGYKFMIRPDSNGEFYMIKDGILEYIPNIRDIADYLSEYMKENVENTEKVLEFFTKKKQVKWISENEYFNLVK